MALIQGKPSEELCEIMRKAVLAPMNAIYEFSSALSEIAQHYNIDLPDAIEKKYERPLWAKYLCRKSTFGSSDKRPYYWVGEGRVRRVTTKRFTTINYLQWHDDFIAVRTYDPPQFKRPFFEELVHTTRLEF